MTKTTPTTSVGLKLVLDPLWLMESEGYRPRWAHFLVAAQSKPISRKIPQLRSRIKLCWNSQVFEWRSNYVLILENQSFQCDHRASLEAETLKNLPAMQETCVWSMGWEDTLEKGKATHSSILAWRSQGCKELDVTLGLPCGSAGKESSCNVGDQSSVSP